MMADSQSLALVTKTFRGKVYRWRPGSSDIAIWDNVRDAGRLIPDRVIAMPDWVIIEKVDSELFELIVWIYADAGRKSEDEP